MINTRRGDFSGGRVLLLKIHRRMPGLHARAVRKARFPSVHTSPEALMATDDSLSAASTPDRSSEARRHVHAGFEKVVSLRLRDGEEVFTVSPPAGVQLGNREARAVLEDRLFLTSSSVEPKSDANTFYFSLPREMAYVPLCDDFGPFNLGTTHHFCDILTVLLADPALANKRLVFWVAPTPRDLTNGIYLLGAFLCTRLGATPAEAWVPFADVPAHIGVPYRDATWVPSTFDITVRHCWEGLRKAIETGLYIPDTFDKNEYLYYDSPLNGDLHEVVRGKFYAFKGPTARRRAEGRWSLLPTDYFAVFRSKKIRTVVRLNKPEYAASEVVAAGFTHHDMFFTDCSTPSDAIVERFLRVAENSQGGIAVHCLAGLGRTGTLIALWMMKHMRFTGTEAIAWLRICRPGSVIGPQQQYVVEQEQRMWRLAGQPGLGGSSPNPVGQDRLDQRGNTRRGLRVQRGSRASSAQGTCGDSGCGNRAKRGGSEELATMVAHGMTRRDVNRCSEIEVAREVKGGSRRLPLVAGRTTQEAYKGRRPSWSARTARMTGGSMHGTGMRSFFSEGHTRQQRVCA